MREDDRETKCLNSPASAILYRSGGMMDKLGQFSLTHLFIDAAFSAVIYRAGIPVELSRLAAHY